LSKSAPPAAAVNHTTFFLVCLTCFTLILQLPYLLGHLTTPSDLVYTHLIMNPEDAHTYWAKMVQGFHGAWGYTIPFTAVPHPPAFVGGFYLGLGHLARLLGLSLTAVWHLSRITTTLLLGAAIWLFTGHFLPRRGRRTAFLLALFGSGFGWLLLVLGQPFWLGAFPVDFKQPGAHIFFTALTFPHITAGTAFILLSMLSMKQVADATPSWRRWALLAGFSNLLLGIAYPFLLYIIMLTTLLFWVALSWRARRPRRRLALRLNLQFILPAPLYLYYAIVLTSNPVFQSWDAQAGTPSPPWPHFLVAFGPYLLLILWPYLARRKPARPPLDSDAALLWCWLAAAALLLYAPLGPQRRFVQGAHVPLALLAAGAFVHQLLPAWRQSGWWQRLVARPRYTTPALSRFLSFLLLLFLSIGNLYLLADVSNTAVFVQPDPLFRPVPEFAALAWIESETAPDAPFLAAYQSGNLIAGRTARPVVWGHWAETMAEPAIAAAVNTFFNSETDNGWRIGFLANQGVQYVWFSPREAELGAFQPAAAPFLEPVYENGMVRIFQVRLPPP